MNFFEKIRRKKEVKEYIDQAENDLNYSLNKAEENLGGIKRCLKECGKYLDLNNKDHVYMQEAYTKRIVEKTPAFSKHMLAANNLFAELKKYIDENFNLVSNRNKANAEKFNKLLNSYKQDILKAYEDAQELKIDSKHSSLIIEELNKTIENFPSNSATNSKEEDNNINIEAGI